MSDQNEIKEEKKEESMAFDANQMTISDCVDLMNEVVRVAEQTIPAFDDVLYAQNWSKAMDAVGKLADVLSNGRMIEFARRNKWIWNNQKKWYEEDSEQDKKDKLEVLYTLKLVNKTAEFRHELVTFLYELGIKEVLKNAYVIGRVCYELQCVSDEYKMLILGFNEYHKLRLRYDVAGIYNELGVSRELSADENFKIILKHMDDSIDQSRNLNGLFYELNWFHVIDRNTMKLAEVISHEDIFIGMLNTLNSLYAKCQAYNAEFNDNFYFRAIMEVLDHIKAFLEKRSAQIKEFKNNTTEAPYCIMHYDVTVVDVTNRWLMDSLPDPVTNGTKYEELIKHIQKTFAEQARVLVKHIP